MRVAPVGGTAVQDHVALAEIDAKVEEATKAIGRLLRT